MTVAVPHYSRPAVPSGRWGAGTTTKPVQGNSRALPAVGERLAGGKLGMRSGRSCDRSPSGWWWIGAGLLLGAHREAVRAWGHGDRTLDATARRGARVWGGARGRDSVAWDVVAGAGAPGRPPAGSRGLPPHAPASWQGAWACGRSSAQRRSRLASRPQLGHATVAMAVPIGIRCSNSRSRRSDSRRWPLSPPKVRRSEA